MIEVLLFDLLDTLVVLPYKPRDLIFPLVNMSDPREVEELSDAICAKRPNISVDEFLDEFLIRTHINNNSDLSAKVRNIWIESMQQAQLLPNVAGTLRELRNCGFRLAIVSNTTPPSRCLIRKFHFNEIFEDTVFSCDVGSRKPDPQIYQMALRSLHIDPPRTCMIGNRWDTDLIGAVRLELYGILLGNRNDIPEAWRKVDRIIGCISEMGDLPKLVADFNLQSNLSHSDHSVV